MCSRVQYAAIIGARYLSWREQENGLSVGIQAGAGIKPPAASPTKGGPDDQARELAFAVGFVYVVAPGSFISPAPFASVVCSGSSCGC